MKTLFDKIYEEGEDRKNLGFDYSGVLMKKTLSNRMFNNDTLSGFITYVNDMMVNLINSVKLIKTFYNYSISKDDKNIK